METKKGLPFSASMPPTRVVQVALKQANVFTLLILICSVVPSSSAECPSACFCDAEVQYVSCVGDGIGHVPRDLPRSSERLELRSFAVEALSQATLAGVAALKELKLQQSQTRAIEDGALSGLALLQRLDLSQNALENLTSGTFQGLQTLKYLDLSSNQLAHIDGAFSGLGSLEQLNLRNNLLLQLNTYTFAGLRRMQYLNLDSNLISSLEVGAFQSLPSLGHLILSNNPLASQLRLSFFGSRLQYIDASHVGLGRVPPSLTRYVRDLRLGRNNISRIALGDLDSYPHLGLLVLDDNAIEDVEDDALGRQEYLARLRLNGNRLTRVPLNLPATLVALYIEENLISRLEPHSFPGLSNLEQLFLQRNMIENISEDALSDLVKLKTLDLQANLIQVLPNYVFSNLSELQTLDISQNPLRTLAPQCFQGLEALQTLKISRVANRVEFEEYVFDPLKNLTKLEMYDSSKLVADIINSTRTLHGLRNVEELNLMHNKLTRLRLDFPAFFPKMKVFKVGGNAFHCSSDVRWFSDWIKTSSIQFYSSYSIRCASPVTLQFKPIMLLKEEDFYEATAVTTLASQGRPSVIVKRVPLSTEAASVSIDPMITAASEPSVATEFTAEGTNQTTAEVTVSNSSNSTEVYTLNNSISTVAPNALPSVHMQQALSSTQSPMPQGLFDSRIGKTAPANNETLPTHDETRDNTQNITLSFPKNENGNTTAASRPAWQMLPASRVTVSAVQVNHSSAQQLGAPQSLLFESAVAEKHRQDPSTESKATVTSTVVTGCSFLLFVSLVTVVLVLQMRHNCIGCRERYSRIQRSSSISYRPQHDEVNILTVSEGTVADARTSSQRGIRNKLYFAVECGGGGPHDTPNEPQLQELVPRSLSGSEWCSGHVCT
ncbi:uncharacterized protein LOC144178362 [Haemaphysalis longicornis]